MVSAISPCLLVGSRARGRQTPQHPSDQIIRILLDITGPDILECTDDGFVQLPRPRPPLGTAIIIGMLPSPKNETAFAF